MLPIICIAYVVGLFAYISLFSLSKNRELYIFVDDGISGVRARVSPRGSAVDRVALAQLFPRVLIFSPASIILSWRSKLISHLGDEQ
jgi:hypothetical protein